MPKVEISIRASHPSPGVIEYREHVEWTPSRSLDPKVRLPSTWRSAIGVPLTDAKIRAYEEEGVYGPAAQNRALERKKKLSLTSNGIVIRCGCGQKDTVRYLRFAYLPRPGYYCKLCRERYRADAEKAESESAAWKEKVLAEFV